MISTGITPTPIYIPGQTVTNVLRFVKATSRDPQEFEEHVIVITIGGNEKTKCEYDIENKCELVTRYRQTL